ncbi:MAG: VanZ family protein [Acetobacteraceae bacterium]|nr:VanZ family protein [Acetobacteraceae bacterium]
MSASRYAIAAFLYAVTMVYASTLVGPMGPHYIPIDPYEAWSRLIEMPYVSHGSDQRSDWMGNLGMLVPLGFLVAGWFSPSYRHVVIGGIVAFILCLAFILAVKYAQLFFPPRTVNLNYVLAQSLGSALGIILRGALRRPLIALGQRVDRIENLRTILWVYTALTIVFFLTPLDFALNTEDLTIQFEKLPATLTAISGAGRPAVVGLVLALASILLMMPVGALLTFRSRGRVHIGRSVGAATWNGFCAMVVVYALTALVISGAASLPGVGFRTIGIALGAWGIHWLVRQNPDHIRYRLGRFVPWAVPVYLAIVAAVNGLVSVHWIGPSAASADFYRLGLYPLFNYYIVTKPQAAKNIAAHAVMYAPIGVMIWLSARQGGGRATAFVLAAILSGLVEAGRFFRPGLVPDINAIPLAGAAAWAATVSMPVLWRMLGTVAIGHPMALLLQPARDGAMGDWRDRDVDRRTRRRDHGEPLGDVEEY